MHAAQNRTASSIDSLLETMVSERRIPGYVYAIHGPAGLIAGGHGGYASIEAGSHVGVNSVFRLFSMTKPVTSVAALMLIDEGVFGLDDPVSRFIPEFDTLRVWSKVESDGALKTTPLTRPITIRHLLTHTAGLTYHFMASDLGDGQLAEGPVQQLYRKKGIKPSAGKIAPSISDGPPVGDPAAFLNAVLEVPLIDQPGKQFHYSIATDILGIVMERATGAPLGGLLSEKLFEPLNMADTGFSVQSGALSRFTSNYRLTANGLNLVDPFESSDYVRRPKFESGGGGLVGTLGDYVRFLTMLLRGGTLDGRRYLKDETFRELCRPQLSAVALAPSTLEASKGTSFGLGLGIYQDNRLAETPVPVGSVFWNGAAATYCWIDSVNEIVGVVMTQVLENEAHRIDKALHRLLYADPRF